MESKKILCHCAVLSFLALNVSTAPEANERSNLNRNLIYYQTCLNLQQGNGNSDQLSSLGAPERNMTLARYTEAKDSN